MTPDQIKTLEDCFRNAIEKKDYLTYFIEAYTLNSGFHKVLNRHLAMYILDYFDESKLFLPTYRLVNCLAHIVTLLIHHPDVSRYQYRGLCYRGMRITQNDLNQYQLNQHMLNRSFLSTSTDRGVAEMFAGEGEQSNMRHTPKGDRALQYSCVCQYSIKQNATAIYIQKLSKNADENEVLILPFTVFKVVGIKRNDLENPKASISVEIQLEECEDSHEDQNRLEKMKKTKQRKFYSIVGLLLLVSLLALCITVYFVFFNNQKSFTTTTAYTTPLTTQYSKYGNSLSITKVGLDTFTRSQVIKHQPTTGTTARTTPLTTTTTKTTTTPPTTITTTTTAPTPLTTTTTITPTPTPTTTSITPLLTTAITTTTPLPPTTTFIITPPPTTATIHRVSQNIQEINCSQYETDFDIIKLISPNAQLNSKLQKPITQASMNTNDTIYYLQIINQETCIPSIIFCFEDLETLIIENAYFCDSKRRNYLPEQIITLKKLTTLKISHVNLTSLPNIIWNLSALTDLIISHVNLTFLPNIIRNLSSLQRLSIFNTTLRSLPKTISNLKSLKRLQLQNNPYLHSIKEIDGLPALRSLDARHCSVEDLPRNLPQLVDLYMPYNSLTRLNSDITTLSNKANKNQNFEFNNNRITSITPEIRYLHTLSQLHLDHNQLHNLPKDIFDMKKLTYLYLRNNSFLPKFLMLFVFILNNNNEVRRRKEGDERRTIVAGGNGQGSHLNQLNYPTFIFVDEDSSLYVLNRNNNRVMKWRKNAKEGIVVADGNGQEKN
ncbi:unnamed protein product [Adineta steineri]|nr:unnamed protein product [Adineta steineri]